MSVTASGDKQACCSTHILNVALNQHVYLLEFLYQQICLNQLHLTYKHIFRCVAEPAGIYMLHLPQTRSFVPMLLPNLRPGKHNCTRPSCMYFTVAPVLSSHVFISCILSACMSVTVLSYQDPCILHLHTTISHVCNNCIWPFPRSLTIAPNQ